MGAEEHFSNTELVHSSYLKLISSTSPQVIYVEESRTRVFTNLLTARVNSLTSEFAVEHDLITKNWVSAIVSRC